jgi:hypothetical protein
MRNKIINKTLVIITIILLISTTPLLVTAGIKETNVIKNTSTNIINDLGTIKVTHQPWFALGPPINVVYVPPEDNPTFEYYFPQDENGYVDMNFTVNITHLLNTVPPGYFAKWIWPEKYRYTVVTLWIRVEDVDYIIVDKNAKNCSNITFPETYQITLTTDPDKRLKTNNDTKEGTFWWHVLPGIGPNPKIWDIISLFPVSRGGSKPIFVIPII